MDDKKILLSERDKLSFEQNNQFHSDILKIFTQMMIIFVTINGGLFYAAFQDSLLSNGERFLFAFVSIVDIFIAYFINNLRNISNYTLLKIYEFNPNSFPYYINDPQDLKKAFGVTGWFSVLVMLTGIFCIFFSFIGNV